MPDASSRFVLRFSRLRTRNKAVDPVDGLSCREVGTATESEFAAAELTCSEDPLVKFLPPLRNDSYVNELVNPSEIAPVTLHVYDRLVKRSADSQVPFVHLGVEVYGVEFAYVNSGIRYFKPGLYDKPRHRGSLPLGCTELQPLQVRRMIKLMKDQEFGDNHYKLIGHNCQTFAAAFVERLGLSTDSIPESCVRFAKPWVVGGVDVMDLLPSGSDSHCCKCSDEACESSGQGICSHV